MKFVTWNQTLLKIHIQKHRFLCVSFIIPIFGHITEIPLWNISSRKLRGKLPSKILISLSTSLLVLLIVFLAGIAKTSNRTGCQLTAVLLHYFTLATFTWMGVEGFNIYQMFVKVFQKESQKRFLIQASMVGWGK